MKNAIGNQMQKKTRSHDKASTPRRKNVNVAYAFKFGDPLHASMLFNQTNLKTILMEMAKRTSVVNFAANNIAILESEVRYVFLPTTKKKQNIFKNYNGPSPMQHKQKKSLSMMQYDNLFGFFNIEKHH